MINVSLVLLIVLLLIASIYLNKSFENPTSIFIGFWLLQILLVCLFTGSKNISLSFYKYLIIIFIAIISINLIFIKNIENLNRNNKSIDIRCIKLKKYTIISIALGLLASVYKFYSITGSLNIISGFSNIGIVANTISISRYMGDGNSSISQQLLLVFIYLSAFFGGIIAAERRIKNWRILALCTFIPTLINSIVNGARSGIITYIAFFIASYFSFNIYYKNKINIKHILIVIFISISLTYIFGLVQVVRGNEEINNSNIIKYVKSPRLVTYYLGHIPAFGEWIDTNYDYSNKYYGAYNFASIFNMLEIKKVESGIFKETVTVFKNSKTNIYTYFRCLIEDFGYIGSIIIISIIYFIIMKVYTGRKNKLKIIYMTIFYSYIIFFITSVFNYTTHILAMLLFVFYIIKFVKFEKLQVKNYEH